MGVGVGVGVVVVVIVGVGVEETCSGGSPPEGYAPVVGSVDVGCWGMSGGTDPYTISDEMWTMSG